ncbi:hypothetical protein SAMN04487859_105116 [Roseovarius lutimaris]|uniref:Cytochrome c domain-containing protein n=2 Tax=Roseovarius lutimaris TaxID=1005928 RepID=A0A1I5A7T2_9RHOB|nr:hypothetical protein SAMN04487859_105116 [Roseovarius lutimaris]
MFKVVDADMRLFLTWDMQGWNPSPKRVLRMIVFCLMALLPVSAMADERLFRLSAPEALIASGVLDYLRPRFSLKTGVRIEIVAPGAEAEIALGNAEGRAVFIGEGATWRMQLRSTHAGAARFADWLTSEIGQRTLTSYEVEGRAPFSLPEAKDEAEVALVFEGNAVQGKALSLRHCGRCHVVSHENRMNAIGSTPSFAVLRALPNWAARFQGFFALNPHPAFTQVADITEPFAAHRPPPIVPVEITVDDLEAILAYVSGVVPADLGAPIEHQ